MFVEVLLETLYEILGDEAEITKMKSITKVLSFCLFKLLEYTLLPTTVRPMEMSVNFRDNKVEAIVNQLEVQETIDLNLKMEVVAEQIEESKASESQVDGDGGTTTSPQVDGGATTE